MSCNIAQPIVQMASSHSLFFILPIVFISLLSQSESYSSVAALSHPSASKSKVNLTLYYESLCPYCASFITENLVEAVTTDLINIINLRIVPWGNAMLEESSNTIICQHGENECYLNTVEACAINIWHDVLTYFSFTHCVEAKLLEDDSQALAEAASGIASASVNEHSEIAEKAWKSCTTQLKLDENLITKCLTDGAGRKLELQYGDETGQLNPPHEYVPWVVVNGKPILQDYKNYIHYVCKAYKGKQKPKACNSTLSNPKKQSKSIPDVSFYTKQTGGENQQQN